MPQKELDQYKIRTDKLNKIKKLGITPFPSKAKRTHLTSEVITDFVKLKKTQKTVSLVGRIKTLRLHGGSLFTHIEDGYDKFQIYLKKDIIKEDKYNIFIKTLEIGDFIEVSGKLFKTKKGEKTLNIEDYKILSKALLPLPEKWHGLIDQEIRFRKRYLDLIANPDIKLIFRKRSKIVKAIREFLDQHNFLEVETPILQPIPGGANANPFKTHHQALNIDLYLRIAPELYLKRLIIGGFEKVYEISRCFRNEGIDFAHNPEFTQVEFYWAYADYLELMKFTEKMMVYILKQFNQNLVIKYKNFEIDFNPPYKRLTFLEAIKNHTNIDIRKENENGLRDKAKKLGLKIEKGFHKAKIIDELYKKIVRPKIIQPTFLIDHPIELSPLTKKKPDNPDYTERFQLIVASLELCNAFSELNDPQEQLTRFKEQEKYRKAGDSEAQRIDHDFIEALKYGMPPCAGFGLGIDRLSAILNNVHNIKEVILFPTLRPKK